MFTLLADHANRSLSQLRGILWLPVHGSIFSEVGASAKPGAVQSSRVGYSPNEIFKFFRSMDCLAFTLHGGRLREFTVMDDNTAETNFFFLHKFEHRGLLESPIR
jgi:hypothetical protein